MTMLIKTNLATILVLILHFNVCSAMQDEADKGPAPKEFGKMLATDGPMFNAVQARMFDENDPRFVDGQFVGQIDSGGSVVLKAEDPSPVLAIPCPLIAGFMKMRWAVEENKAPSSKWTADDAEALFDFFVMPDSNKQQSAYSKAAPVKASLIGLFFNFVPRQNMSMSDYGDMHWWGSTAYKATVVARILGSTAITAAGTFRTPIDLFQYRRINFHDFHTGIRVGALMPGVNAGEGSHFKAQEFRVSEKAFDQIMEPLSKGASDDHSQPGDAVKICAKAKELHGNKKDKGWIPTQLLGLSNCDDLYPMLLRILALTGQPVTRLVLKNFLIHSIFPDNWFAWRDFWADADNVAAVKKNGWSPSQLNLLTMAAPGLGVDMPDQTALKTKTFDQWCTTHCEELKAV